jgi:cytidylate kinase
MMAIIAISRELAALGDETAHELAKLLNYRFVDKVTLEDRIKSYGVVGRKFEKYDERKPSFFASFSPARDDYLHYLRTAMLTEAQGGNCIFIGRGAGAIFKGLPGGLSVFLVAPEEVRWERVACYFRCDERRARQLVEKSDHDRRGFYRYFFDMDWKASDNYHLTLNTGHLHPRVSAEIIKNVMDRIITEDAEARCVVQLKDLILAQQVIHHIIYEKEIPIHFLESSVSGDQITLLGVANSQALVEAAAAAAREFSPGSTVHAEIQVVREYAVIR